MACLDAAASALPLADSRSVPWDSSRAQRGSRSRRLAEVSQQEVRLCSSGGSGREVSSPLDSAWGRKKSSSFRQNLERNGRDSCLYVQDTKRSLWRAGKGCRSPLAHPSLPSFSPQEQNSPRLPTPTRPPLLKPAHSSYKIPRIGYLKRKKKKKAHAQLLVPCCWNPSQHAELFYCLIQARLCALVGHFPTARLCLRSASPVCLPHWWGDQNQGSKYKNTTAPPPAGVKKRKE